MAGDLYRKTDGGAAAKDRRDRIQQYAESLIAVRQSGFDPHWRDLADFIMPRRVRWFTDDKNRGDKRNQKIIDSTARFSARTLASGLHAGLTSPARPWMKLTTPDPELAKIPVVKSWLHDVTQRMLVVFAQTNFYNTLPITYGDLGVFSVGAQAMLPDSKDLFRCYNYAIGSWAIGVDGRGVVSSFVREYQLSVENLVKEFALDHSTGEVDWTILSKQVKDHWDAGNYQIQIDVMWLVCPNEDYEEGRIGRRGFKFASYHFETNSGETKRQFLRESGYRSFPVQVPRWDVTDGDSYGTDGPAMTCLGDVKQLQVMQRRKAQAIHKMVDPPLKGPSSLRTQKTSLLPGDITYVDAMNGQQSLESIHDVNLRIDHLSADIVEVQSRIQRSFYEDLFLMLARSDNMRGAQPVTAREVEERHEEKLIALGPVLERTNDELLDPAVDRAFEFMNRAGLIPEPPEQLEGVNLKVEYISILAQAQKLVGVVGLDRLLTNVVGLAPTFPKIVNKIKVNAVVDEYAELLGTSPALVRSDDEADELGAQQDQAQRQMEEAAAMKDTSTALKNAGTTPMDDNTALSRIVGNAAAVA